MVFTRRERMIIAVTVIVLAALVLDRYALTPLLDSYSELQVKKDGLQSRMINAGSTMDRSRIQGRRWRKMLDDGMKWDPAGAESQIMHAARRWSYESGLKLTSLKPHRSEEKTELPIIEFRATASGSWRAVYRFLARAETAKIPIRIKSIRATSRKSGTDDLNVQLELSTIYSPDHKPKVKEVWKPQTPKKAEPVETRPVSEPATAPAETQPATAPTETQPATTPAETQPASSPAGEDK
jgi:hypothetical protein